MRKLVLRIVISLLTFSVGMSMVFIARKVDPTPSESVFVVSPSNLAEMGLPRFSPTTRGCGMGYTQGYQTDDGKPLAEGGSWSPTRRVTERKFRKWVRNSKQIIERIPNYRDHRGRVGERVILINKPDDSGQDSISILFYDGSDSYHFIDAPSVDLALEFEQYLISIDFKSPL
jgi:hypothetical protein